MAALVFENLREFFDVNEFATTATIYGEGGAQEILGIFDEPSIDAEIGQHEFEASSHKFRCAATDVLTMVRSDRLTIEGRDFWLEKAPQPDGTGLAVLFLAPEEVD